MVVEKTATLEENPAYQLKVAELKKYWRTLRALDFEIKKSATRRKTIAVQIAVTGLTKELRASFGLTQDELRLSRDIRENVDQLNMELLNEINGEFGHSVAGPAVMELYRTWEHAIQHGLD